MLDRHVVVTVMLETVTQINLTDFNIPAIIGGLCFELRIEPQTGTGKRSKAL